MYIIEIKQITREHVTESKYEVVGKDENGDEEYGYVDNETTEDVERTIYTQRVDELDIKQVIGAVNPYKP